MKTIAIIVNIFFPGVGSVLAGKYVQGIFQIILYIIGLVLAFTVIGAIVGIPLCIGVWIWGIITAVNVAPQPLQVTVVHEYKAAPPN